jgi:hypothetical protein
MGNLALLAACFEGVVRDRLWDVTPKVVRWILLHFVSRIGNAAKRLFQASTAPHPKPAMRWLKDRPNTSKSNIVSRLEELRRTSRATRLLRCRNRQFARRAITCRPVCVTCRPACRRFNCFPDSRRHAFSASGRDVLVHIAPSQGYYAPTRPLRLHHDTSEPSKKANCTFYSFVGAPCDPPNTARLCAELRDRRTIAWPLRYFFFMEGRVRLQGSFNNDHLTFPFIA